MTGASPFSATGLTPSQRKSAPSAPVVPDTSENLSYFINPPALQQFADAPAGQAAESRNQLAAPNRAIPSPPPGERPALAPSAEPLPFEVLLQVDVTAEQLPDVLARLRGDQLQIVAELHEQVGAGRGVSAGGIRADEELALKSPSASAPLGAGMQGVLLQAAVQDVQASLQRANVVVRVLDVGQLELADKRWYGTNPETQAEWQQGAVLRQRALTESVEGVERTAGVGQVLVLFKVLPSAPPWPAQASPDERE